MSNTYDKFLIKKRREIKDSGFSVELTDLNNDLFEFQKHITRNALRLGRYAIFADCGLGKTLMQLEWSHQVWKNTGKPVLIVAPLAVSSQTIKEGKKFGYVVQKYSESNHTGIDIVNYEQLKNVDCSIYSGVVLDESSILKNFTGKYRKLIIECFTNTQYKLACTATPSPNDIMELGNHSEFLDVMKRNEMLAMFFVHDGGQTAKWRLKRHAEKEFYAWMRQWAVMMTKPSDLGFKEKGYNLPKLEFINTMIEVAYDENDTNTLFHLGVVSATNFNQELRKTQKERLKAVADIVNSSDEPFIVWVKQNAESSAITKMISGAVEVKGSDKPEVKEKNLLDFADNKFRVLVTKTKIAQFGLNYQNCRNQVFASLDFSFESLYQAVRRSYRFGQSKDVRIYMITTDTMGNVIKAIETKQRSFETMQEQMATASNGTQKTISEISQFNEVKNECFHIKNGDSVKMIEQLKDESIGFSVFSPPFADLYTYSDYAEDMGNCSDYEQFCEHFNYLIKNLYYKMMSGRNVAVHCMDLPIQKGKEGFIGLRDFSGMILRTFEDAGFIYHSRVTIWKNPVTEMQRTKALGLLHKQVKKDSTMSRVGIPDYLLIFRKDGERDNPVKTKISVDLWQQYASPVWMDIDYSKTLQYRDGRDEKDEKHICPLQLDTIERAITLYTNEGDTVFTPFMGIGSEVYQAVKMKRYGIGFELKPSYFAQAEKNLTSAMAERQQMELF